ncbi:hypothetical protein [Bacillus salipaludis]|uniref:Spore germination protein n=1 Tax=Bacillus salipaludis TaxID=2547811 RepID=A0ABW8RA61_9BACI
MTPPNLSPTFHIGTIKIGSIAEASCFSIGNNFIEDFKSSKKHNQGLGNIHGDRNNFAHTTASLTNYEPSPMKQKQIKQEKKENPYEI